jgi:iron complex transport system ATP-binding protein
MKKPPAPVLSVKKLRVVRDGNVILDGVDWRVQHGEHWAVLGANGSGKTSLFSVLLGYLTPTDGEIELLGGRYGEADWRELRLRIGFVSSAVRQMMAEAEPALISVASGKYAMIDFWGTPNRADRALAKKILRRIECAHLTDRPWAVLSQGERQRILIGRALMANPRLLILDEPCAGLDPAAREHFLQFLARLGAKKNSPTLVLVTHHVEEIMPAFTHVLALKDGGALAAGKKAALLTSRLLSQTFGAGVKLKRTGGRYTVTVSADRRVVV